MFTKDVPKSLRPGEERRRHSCKWRWTDEGSKSGKNVHARSAKLRKPRGWSAKQQNAGRGRRRRERPRKRKSASKRRSDWRSAKGTECKWARSVFSADALQRARRIGS